MLRPSPRTPKLPTGVPVEVAVASLNDVPGLRAAMHGVSPDAAAAVLRRRHFGVRRAETAEAFYVYGDRNLFCSCVPLSEYAER